MTLKNEALQELYDTLLYGPVLSSPYADSPIDRAFKECDEKLSGSAAFAHIKDLENRCENLERSNKALRDDNDKLGDKVIGLNKKNEQLEKDIEELQKSRKCYRQLHVGEGARKLWEMVQIVNDLKPGDFDPECDTKGDIFSMDLDDFLDQYKKWTDSKKETAFDYGDAVRLPWHDHDYMYIGPNKTGEQVRLFNLREHQVYYVYNTYMIKHLEKRGYKIIISNEDDLRKIWKGGD